MDIRELKNYLFDESLPDEDKPIFDEYWRRFIGKSEEEIKTQYPDYTEIIVGTTDNAKYLEIRLHEATHNVMIENSIVVDVLTFPDYPEVYKGIGTGY